MTLDITLYPYCDRKTLTSDEELQMRYLELASAIDSYIEALYKGKDVDRYDTKIAKYALHSHLFAERITHYIYSYEDLKNWDAPLFRKTALTKIRILTEEDYYARNGVIDSMESERYSFAVGDYLGQGKSGEEWVMNCKYVERVYEMVVNTHDADGFDLYQKKECVKAVHMPRAFRLADQNNRLLCSEREGGWMVWNDAGELWICADSLFVYEEVS